MEAAIDLTADFKAAFGRGARKRLSHAAGVSPETVKRWFAGNWPASRRAQFSELLIRHIEGQEKMLDEIKDRARRLAANGL